MWLKRISGGGADLIDLADAKAHLRLLEDDFDAEVSRAVSAASVFLDLDQDGFGIMGGPLLAQQWSSKAAGFTCEVLRLPFGRVIAVDEIRYLAPDGSAGVVNPATYVLAQDGRTPVVCLLPGQSWPQVASRPDAVDLRFAAGFGVVGDVPEDIRAAARLLTGHFFRNRDAASDVLPQEIALGVDRIAARYRRCVG